MTRKICFLSTNDFGFGGSEDLWTATAFVMAKSGWQVGVSVRRWDPLPEPVEALVSAGCTMMWHDTPGSIQNFAEIIGFCPQLVVVSQGFQREGMEWLERLVKEEVPFFLINQCVHEVGWLGSDDAAIDHMVAIHSAAREFVFVSEGNRRLYERMAGTRLTNAAVVRNPFKVDYNVQLPWPGGTALQLATAGRLECYHKGYDLLFEVLALPKWRNRALEIHLYGEGPHRRLLERLAQRSGFPAAMFHGQVSNITEIWQRHHVLVQPSRLEGLPLSVVEAMLCGRPVVATDVAGHGEVIRDSVTGFLAAAPTAALLDTAMERMWEARERLEEMSAVVWRDIRSLIPPDPAGDLAQRLARHAVGAKPLSSIADHSETIKGDVAGLTAVPTPRRFDTANERLSTAGKRLEGMGAAIWRGIRSLVPGGHSIDPAQQTARDAEERMTHSERQPTSLDPELRQGASGGSPESGTAPIGRGFFDSMEYQNGRLVVSGWQFLPDHPFDGFALKINGIRTGETRLRERADVHRVFPGFPAALPSGFSAEAAIPEADIQQWIDIEMVGMQGDREISRLTTIFKLGYRGPLPEPPAHLMRRVAATGNSMLYWCTALTSYGEFSRGLARHAGAGTIDRLLDWGCGCGRVVSLFLEHSAIPEIHGCDIDPEGVAWCQANLGKGRFRVVNPNPPTDYQDNMFAAVIGYSVFTHLVREVQKAWLGEMRRIIKPGGLFLASCQGDFATLFAPPAVQQEVRDAGISDISPDPSLDGIAPAGYYRGVFQSREYTMREWGKYFDVIEYIPKGMGHCHDLVIMRKRS